jgi:hypothetical protein
MSKLHAGAATLAAALTVAAAAQGAVPAGVSKAVDRWTKTALQIQDSGILPGAKQLSSALASAQGTCRSTAASRPALAEVVSGLSGELKLFVDNTERGEQKLYALAPKLGRKQSAARHRYVALLDRAGKILDHELSETRLVASASRLISSGNCSKATSDVGHAVSLLHLERNSLDGVIVKLRGQFG